MFGELPKLFDRDFVIGYFLPMALFLVATLSLMAGYNLLPPLLSIVSQPTQLDLLLGTTLLGVASWLGAVVLLLLNRGLLRVIEGYGQFNPARLLRPLTLRSYKRLISERDTLKAQVDVYIAKGQDIPRETHTRLNTLLAKAAEQFPDREDLVLPTMFGNILRSFEIYPRAMYGIGGVIGWNRLLAVVPDKYRQQIDASKAEMDCWINLMVLSALFVVEYTSFAIYDGSPRMLWILLLALFLVPLAYWRARSAAIEWGDMMKASFDVFLPELSEKLHFAPGQGITERQIWQGFSQAVRFRMPDRFPPRTQSKPEQGDGKRDSIRVIIDDAGNRAAILLHLEEWQETPHAVSAATIDPGQPDSADATPGKGQTAGSTPPSSNS